MSAAVADCQHAGEPAAIGAKAEAGDTPAPAFSGVSAGVSRGVSALPGLRSARRRANDSSAMPALLVLVCVSLLAMLAGGIAMIRQTGRTRRRSGHEVGGEIFAQQQAQESEPADASVQPSTFRGKAVAVEGEASIGMKEFKQLIQTRQWRRVLPSLCMILGLLGFMLFGATALLVGLEQKATGVLMLAVALYAVGRIAFDYIRA
jgi:hypothetical protein